MLSRTFILPLLSAAVVAQVEINIPQTERYVASALSKFADYVSCPCHMQLSRLIFRHPCAVSICARVLALTAIMQC